MTSPAPLTRSTTKLWRVVPAEPVAFVDPRTGEFCWAANAIAWPEDHASFTKPVYADGPRPDYDAMAVEVLAAYDKQHGYGQDWAKRMAAALRATFEGE